MDKAATAFVGRADHIFALDFSVGQAPLPRTCGYSQCGMIVTRYLMRTYAGIHFLAPLAVHAQNLIPFREFVQNQPSVSMESRCGSISENFFSEFRPIVIDVIDTQERRFGFTATRALSSVCRKYRRLCFRSAFSPVYEMTCLHFRASAPTIIPIFGAPLALTDPLTAFLGIKIRNWFRFVAKAANLQVFVRDCHGFDFIKPLEFPRVQSLNSSRELLPSPS